MICKIKHGQNFQGGLDYITGKYDKDKQAKVIMHSEGIPLLDNKTVAQIFEAYATKGNNNIHAPVGHYAYSFHKKDGSRVTDELLRKIVREHLELMGIKNTEFIMTRHYDTDHDHAHLICSMVDRDGHVISTAYEKERNARICKYLTRKYGLYISEGKMNVNRNKLRGREKLKYQFYDKAMRCKTQSSDWQQFDKALRAEGLKLCFHYNNVNDRLMGIAFTDGKYTFSGRQLDNELKLSALTEKFGDLKQITHDNVRDWYEDYRQQLHYINDLQGCKAIDKAYPDFDKLFPNGKLPSGGYTSTDGLLSHLSLEYQSDFQTEHENSKDGKTSFVAFELLCDLLLMPYAQPLSIGGGGGSSNNRGWRDLDDDDKEKYRFRINYSHSNKPTFKRKR